MDFIVSFCIFNCRIIVLISLYIVLYVGVGSKVKNDIEMKSLRLYIKFTKVCVLMLAPFPMFFHLPIIIRVPSGTL